MKRNRKIPRKVSVIAANSINVGSVLVVVGTMVILHQLASSSCSQLMRTLGEKERELRRLEEACVRENYEWEKLKTPKSVEMALLKHGIKMAIPRLDQFVRMRTDGTPYPGQLSVSKARQRVTALNVNPTTPDSGYRRKRR